MTSLDLSSFNTSNVTNMNSMFCDCSSLTNLDLSSFNTSNVTKMYETFRGCSSLTSLNLSSFNTNNVTDMREIFRDCSSLTILDLSSFNTSNVTDMLWMFYNCNGLTSLDLSSFNTSNVTNMYEMFYGCSGLTSLDLSSFNTNNVTGMCRMFEGCSKLTTIYCSTQWTTDKVTSSSDMFRGCKKLVGGAGTQFNVSYTDKSYAHVDGGKTNPGYLTLKGAESVEKEAYAVFTDDGTLTFYYDNQKSKRSGTSYELNTGDTNPGWYEKRANITKAVFDASFADARPTTTFSWFYDAKKMTSIDGIENLNTSSVTNMSWMFHSCSGLTSLDVSSFDTRHVANMIFMFTGCSSLPNLDVSNFNTANAMSMDAMFCGCSGLKSLDLSSFNTSKVTNMGVMFAGCAGLTSLDLSNFNTSSVTTMTHMFDGCRSLTNLNLSSFNTSNVKNFHYMFSGCSRLTSLDLRNFDTNNVTSMSVMFSNCSNLTSIYCGDHWSTDKVSSSKDMFTGCTNLVGGDGTTYDSNNTDGSKAYAGIGGYLTLKLEDDLQRYLDSIGDSEDNMADGVYRRKFQNDAWQTLYVPFTVNSSDWTGRFEVARVNGLSQSGESQVVEATTIESGDLEANYPYLIRAKSITGSTLTVNVSNAIQAASSMDFGGLTITGNYAQLTGLKSAKRYRMQGGALSIPGSDSEVLQPYRWYMTINGASARQLRLSINGELPTAIGPTEKTASEGLNIYSLSGSKMAINTEEELKSLPKGVYIINNKKCVIK